MCLSRSDHYYNYASLTLQLQLIAEALVSDIQDGPIRELLFTGQNSVHHNILSAIVIHTAVSLLNQKGCVLLLPLVTLLSKPGDMAVSTKIIYISISLKPTRDSHITNLKIIQL